MKWGQRERVEEREEVYIRISFLSWNFWQKEMEVVWMLHESKRSVMYSTSMNCDSDVHEETMFQLNQEGKAIILNIFLLLY
jgi:hypothetical protein